ncbi:hypothetical protein Patl1_06676 [Pistacia atlantica]|uniref:Uncharacterized protein n=1 Tax=Pistacia atlantica TaxID=434234 RepID=A0ACC1BPW6_9ROSI|nr:hypothetical protein Patl1_06676 [Pistacia atlantica]
MAVKNISLFIHFGWFDYNQPIVGSQYACSINADCHHLLCRDVVYIFLLREDKYQMLLGITFLPKGFRYGLSGYDCLLYNPFLKFNDDPNSDTIQVLVDFKEASYSGGGNLTFKGTLENNAQFTARLFKGELLLGDSPVHFSYSTHCEQCNYCRPDPVDLAHGPAEYFAMLGHLTVPQGSKNLSMKISWGLLERIFLQYPKYNVYVEKLAEETFQNRHGRREGARKYLGVAHVQAFYVSKLTVPSGIASLKFIIQPCDNDGSIQKLDDSPFFQLDV